ncbi:MAG TPA: TIGR03086 family metal-binding protein [Streptosporangiaceae bacterium]|nr:TIGR03086 family metal-binding protein [Streptosporangiaceae bacterium]
MSTDTSTLSLLERAVRQMDSIIGQVRPEQGSLPTPCGEWDVRALITHLVGHMMPNFVAAANGGTPDWQAPAAAVPDDWAQAFRGEADQLLGAWRGADMDRLVAWGGAQAPLRGHADQQITELAMHSWDLAKATSQDVPLDPSVAEHALNWSKPMLRPEYRGSGRGFADEVPVPQDAPIYGQLAGWFGRDPGWAETQPGAGE